MKNNTQPIPPELLKELERDMLCIEVDNDIADWGENNEKMPYDPEKEEEFLNRD